MNTQPLQDIRHENGFAYIAATHHPELSAHRGPSEAIVLENGMPLPGPANSVHDNIRQLGGGRYCFWHDTIYFSTPDNSDPRANGRSYTIGYTRHIFDMLTPLIPTRWRHVWLRGTGRALTIVRHLGPAQLFWSTFYWLCFAYVLLRERKD
jgi:hypothetical protein